jgi:Domain of Unknown Function (DUF928)
MSEKKSRLSVVAVALGLSLPVTIATSSLAPARAGVSTSSAGNGQVLVVSQFNPPDRGAPVNTTGGASRGSCVESLMPTDANHIYFGLTVAAQPTFYWKINNSKGQTVYFEVQEYTNPSERQTGEDAYKSVYQTEFTLPNTSGVMSFNLPSDIALEEGKAYKWYMDVDCDPTYGDLRSAEGWVERTSPSQAVQRQLGTASAPIDRSQRYAEAGIWFDALDVLAKARLTGDTPELQSNWQALIQDADIKLNNEEVDVFQAPLFEFSQEAASSEQSLLTTQMQTQTQAFQ